MDRVIKHRAPNGALRLGSPVHEARAVQARHKAPSAKRRIKTRGWRGSAGCRHTRHKEQSAKRRIKTCPAGEQGPLPIAVSVIKHRAPNRALRPLVNDNLVNSQVKCVIKHQAPNGALRQLIFRIVRIVSCCQVIKHRVPNGALRPPRAELFLVGTRGVIKHRAPNGALGQVDLEARVESEVGDVIKHQAPNGALRQVRELAPPAHVRES